MIRRARLLPKKNYHENKIYPRKLFTNRNRSRGKIHDKRIKMRYRVRPEYVDIWRCVPFHR